jgi:hypothetical protein
MVASKYVEDMWDLYPCLSSSPSCFLKLLSCFCDDFWKWFGL